MAIMIKGKYSNAIIYNDSIEDGAMKQIVSVANHPATENADIRIMPDVHEGAGICIGFTAKLTDKVVPNWIGVDIGCGVLSYRLGDVSINFKELDNFIRWNIPFGMTVRKSKYHKIEDIVNKLYSKKTIGENHKHFIKQIEDTAKKIDEGKERTIKALGTLGGGNHFIEIDKDSDGAYWLTIHTGSRHFGLSIAKHYQDKAKSYIKSENKRYTQLINEEKRKMGKYDYNHSLLKDYEHLFDYVSGFSNESAYLPVNEGGSAYLDDMKVAQEFALVNRQIIAQSIIENVFELDFWSLEEVESVHNYINFNDRIIRKGAISAYENENIIIPLNMRDGIIIGSGKSNKEWNFSAPHGAGRVFSRKQAKKELSVDEFEKEMKGIWTTCISYDTLDESPMAYKNANEIISYVKDSVDIKVIMKPVYNFKAPE